MLGHVTGAFFLLWGAWLAAANSAGADIWLCQQKDGSVFYTDMPPSGLPCQIYTRSPVVIPYDPPYRPIPYRPALPAPTPPVPMAPSPKAGPDEGARGEIDFEKFRMLSEGMTESEVLALAGSPGSEYSADCLPSPIPGACPKYWLYTYGGNWTVLVTIREGRVTGITNDRHP